MEPIEVWGITSGFVDGFQKVNGTDVPLRAKNDVADRLCVSFSLPFYPTTRLGDDTLENV